MSKYQSYNQRLNYLLQLERKIVGITFIRTKEEFEAYDAPSTKSLVPYCRVVQKATEGESLKLSIDNFGCPASAVALGLIENDEYSASGQKHANMGVYCDLETSKEINDDMVYCKEPSYGIAVETIEDWHSDPDIVLMITTPFNAMRILQGNAYYNGQLKEVKMTGMQALCQEGTSYPYETGHINLSMMCSGTRYVARWKDEELCVGIPFDKFESMIDGLEKTLNPMELIEKKRVIEKKLKADQQEDFYDVRKKENYFRGAYKGVKR